MSPVVLSLMVLAYLGALAALGIKGYRETHSTTDYLLAGRRANPVVMALSYGATFISTSAILGYGGAASIFGVGLIGALALIIVFGVLLAFLVVGKRVRRMGQALGAQTFPELIGKRFQSPVLQRVTALVIILFMPLYIAVVLVGAARYIEATFQVNYTVALAVFGILVAGYVLVGGLKTVMYTDTLQGVLIFAGLTVLVTLTYWQLGGIGRAHEQLAQLPARIEADFEKVLPQVKAVAPRGLDDRQVRAWFEGTAAELKAVAQLPPEEKESRLRRNPALADVGNLLKTHPGLANPLVVGGLRKAGFNGWTRFPKRGSPFFYVLVTSLLVGMSVGMLAQPQLVVRFMTVRSDRELNHAAGVGVLFFLTMVGVLMVGNLSNVWLHLPEHGGRIAAAAAPQGNIDLVIPLFVNRAMPSWFGALFMLTLLSAAMSTLSSQFHLMGTSIGRDLLEGATSGENERGHTIRMTRIGIAVSLPATIVLSLVLPTGIIAVATAMFASLCASSFLPMYIGGMFWRRMTKAGALASLGTGFFVSLFWLMFVQMVNAKHPALLAKVLFSKMTLLERPLAGIHWNWLDALFVALPLATVAGVLVSLVTQPSAAEHLSRCFDGSENTD